MKKIIILTSRYDNKVLIDLHSLTVGNSFNSKKYV